MMHKYRFPIIASLLAILLTSTMDYNGLILFSALPLFALTLIFWFLVRLTANEIGFKLAKPSGYLIAISYPLFVIGGITLFAYLNDQISTPDLDSSKLLNHLLIGSTMGIVMGLITEEGFFRGWLWGRCRSARY